jgi:hypothetical protein
MQGGGFQLLTSSSLRLQIGFPHWKTSQPMSQSLYRLSLASLSTQQPSGNYTPVVTAHFKARETTSSHTPLKVRQYKTEDGYSILIRQGGAGVLVDTHVTGLPYDQLSAPMPVLGRCLAGGPTFTLFPDGIDAGYHIPIKELPACIQTKDGQSTIYTLRNKNLHIEGSYPVRGPLLTQSTYIDPTMCVSHISEIMVPQSSLNAPRQSSPAHYQGSDGHVTNGHAIDGQTSHRKSTSDRSTNDKDTNWTADKASVAFDRRPGRRLATHRPK